MELNKSDFVNSKDKAFSDISWDTVLCYLKNKHEIPIPMHGTDTCVLLIKPGISVEMQMRTKDTCIIELDKLPNLSRFRFEQSSTKSYKYLTIICDNSEFNETVLKFFCSIAFFYVLEKHHPDKAITLAYEHWKNVLTQLHQTDENTLTGLWGELFIINLLLGNSKIDEMCLIRNWTGPLSAANDFSLGNTAIEIKTTAKQSNIIEISSIDQLDAKQAWVVLLHVLHMPVKSGGITISSLVNNITSKLGSPASELFRERLGHIIDTANLSSHDSFSLLNDGMPIAIKVDSTFPMLTRTNMSKFFDFSSSAMLCSVKYSLNLTDKISTGSSDISSLFINILMEDK